MVITRDARLAERMMIFRDHGMEKSRRYWHLYPGYNYRMTNLQAAIGLAQMERLEKFLAHRDAIVARYDARLSILEGIELPPRAPWAKNIHWLYSIVIDPARAGLDRDALSAQLAAQGSRRVHFSIRFTYSHRIGARSKGDFRWPRRSQPMGSVYRRRMI